MNTHDMIHFVAASFGAAAGNSDTEHGPVAIKDSALFDDLPLRYHWNKEIKLQTDHRGQNALTAVHEFNDMLADSVHSLVMAKRNFVVFGGDHSIAMGTWSGASSAIKPHGDLGLIWFDAHMDAHTPETSDSGNFHGMPIATLLGFGEEKLTGLIHKDPKIKPQNLVLIGINSFEEPERELLERLGVTIFYMEDIKKWGMDAIMQKALAKIEHCSAFGVSVDVDCIDAEHMPGTGLPIAGGIHPNELTRALSEVRGDSRCIGLEITEFNPLKDIDNKSLKVIHDIVASVFCDAGCKA